MLMNYQTAILLMLLDCNRDRMQFGYAYPPLIIVQPSALEVKLRLIFLKDHALGFKLPMPGLPPLTAIQYMMGQVCIQSLGGRVILLLSNKARLVVTPLCLRRPTLSTLSADTPA